MSNLHLHQRVLCTDASPVKGTDFGLKKGATYTISKVGILNGHQVVQVAEQPFPNDVYVLATRFRPVAAVFSDILSPNMDASPSQAAIQRDIETRKERIARKL